MATTDDSKKRHQKAASDGCIYELTDPRLGVFFRVTITRNGRGFRKDFHEHRHGGRENARRLAVAWRDQIIQQNPARTRSEFCSIVRSNNTSGIPGVYRRTREYVNRDGTVTHHDCWRARLPAINGRERTRSFSVAQFGEEGARNRAIAVRTEALALIADSLFRPVTQPQVVSTPADIEFLQRRIAEREERRRILIEERRRRREEREREERLRSERAAMAEAQRLAQQKNRTGYPYIGRYLTSESGGNWRVSLNAMGTRFRRTFSDSVYGSADRALEAAVAWRDEMFRRHILSGNRTTAPSERSERSGRVEGVSLIEPNKAGRSGSWVARAPKQIGKAVRTRKFSISKYGAEQAYALAVQARERFVAELSGNRRGLHLVARQLLNEMG